MTVYAPPARVVWRGSFPDREKHTRPVDRGSVCRSALRHHGDTTDLSKRALLAPSSTVFEVHPSDVTRSILSRYTGETRGWG
jgi:hypothetical protein